MIPAGVPLEINGCLNETPWCDVSFVGGRGWVAGRYIQATYQSRRIYVGPQYYRPLGIPTITFNVDDYWGRYYRGRDFYRDRDRWRRGPGWSDRRPDSGWDRRPTVIPAGIMIRIAIGTAARTAIVIGATSRTIIRTGASNAAIAIAIGATNRTTIRTRANSVGIATAIGTGSRTTIRVGAVVTGKTAGATTTARTINSAVQNPSRSRRSRNPRRSLSRSLNGKTIDARMPVRQGPTAPTMSIPARRRNPIAV